MTSSQHFQPEENWGPGKVHQIVNEAEQNDILRKEWRKDRPCRRRRGRANIRLTHNSFDPP